MQTSKIVNFCETYLHCKDFEDYCHNGLQVEGKAEVKRIITGVSLSEKLIRSALERGADMLIVHHGLFMNQVGVRPQLKGIIAKRLKLIMENELNLAGFHLPLDAHPEIGNNISLCRLLGVNDPKPFDVGFYGQLAGPIKLSDFCTQIEAKLGAKIGLIAAGPESVSQIGIISGGSSPDYEQARILGCDAFVCGDLREEVVRGAEEAGINVINAGHYNTEKVGIRNLGDLLVKEFGLEAEFVDIPCQI